MSADPEMQNNQFEPSFEKNELGETGNAGTQNGSASTNESAADNNKNNDNPMLDTTTATTSSATSSASHSPHLDDDALKPEQSPSIPNNPIETTVTAETPGSNSSPTESSSSSSKKPQVNNIESSSEEDEWQANFPPMEDINLNDVNTTNSNIHSNKLFSSISPKHHTNILNTTTTTLTESEMELCQMIDIEYDRSLESLQILLSSKYASFRQSALYSLLFFGLYLCLGTAFYTHHAGTQWTIQDSLLFSIYTITTVGYGNHHVPETPGFQIFTIVYILVGIAALTIVVAQAYSWLALEAARAQYTRDKEEISRRNNPHGDDNDNSGDTADELRSSSTHLRNGIRYVMEYSDMDAQYRTNVEHVMNFVDNGYEQTREFLANTNTGKVLAVFSPLACLVLLGAIVVAPLEGWSFLEGIYWAVVSLTTVGYGYYHPQKNSSIWFCIFYLPCSIGFMSLFLSNVARFYIHMNNSNIQRIQRQMWKRLHKERFKRQQHLEEQRQQQLHQQNYDDENPHDNDHESKQDRTHSDRKQKVHDMTNPSTIPQDHRTKLKSMPEGYDTIADDGDLNPHQTSWFGPAAEPTASSSSKTILHGLQRREKVLERQQTSYTTTTSTPVSAATASSFNASNDLHENPTQEKMTTMKVVLNAIKFEIQQRKAQASVMQNNVEDDQFSNLDSFLFSSSFASSSSSTKPVPVPPQKTSLESPEPPPPPPPTSDGSGGNGSGNDGTRKTFPPQSPKKQSKNIQRKPSFPLRTLVQERMAHIIANDIAGYQSMEFKEEDILSVTIKTFKEIADKWMIPRKARKAFQAVAFEALFFVGERNLIVHGADALLDLGPLEFHGLFSSLLAAMGDADTMEGWLACTDVLADVEFKKGIKGEEAKGGRLDKRGTTSTALSRMIMQGEGSEESTTSRFRRKKKKTNLHDGSASIVEDPNESLKFEIV